MRKIQEYIAGLTRLSAADINTIVAELVRLGKLTVAPPLCLFSAHAGIGIRLQPQLNSLYVQVTGAAEEQEAPHDWFLPVKRVNLTQDDVTGSTIQLKASAQRYWAEHPAGGINMWDLLVPALADEDRFFIVLVQGEWVVLGPFEYD